MILANYAQQNRNCIKEVGIAFTNPFAQFKPTMFPNKAVTDVGNSLAYSGLPHGYNTHYSYGLPMKTGAVASNLNIIGTGSLSASVLAVKLFEAALTGDGSITAIGSLIVQAIAALSGSGAVTDAQVNAFLAAVAALSGSGGVTAANLTGLGDAIAAMTGSGTAAGSTATGIAEAIAALTVTGTGLSTANVGQAVWSALAAANNATGTMGEKLNDAGSASNPWTEVIESGYTAAEILRLLASVAAGSATGLDSSVEFKSLDGTKNRIESTISGNDRTTTSLDVT